MAISVIAWAWLGSVALASSYATISRKVPETLGGLWSVLIWAIFAFQSFSVESNGQQAISYDHTSIAYVAFAAAFVMFIFTVQAVTGQLADPEQTRFATSKTDSRTQTDD